MRFKVNYEELSKLGSFVQEKTEKLDSDYQDILALLEKVKKCWNGVDSDNFVNNSSSFVKYLNVNTNELKNISALLTIIASKYLERDKSFETEIKKEGLENEKYRN